MSAEQFLCPSKHFPFLFSVIFRCAQQQQRRKLSSCAVSQLQLGQDFADQHGNRFEVDDGGG